MTIPVPHRALLAHIVDYAGTFPPASLSLRDAVTTYAREQSGPDAWLLGRFVVRAQDLDAMGTSTTVETEFSVLAGSDPHQTLACVETFRARWAGRCTVAAVEFPPAPPEEIADVARATAGTIDAFFETPIGARLHARLDAIAAAGAAAKVRTGGTTASAIPSATALADFIYACATRKLPFKATAGLHHAVRSCYPLTYERNSDTADMYGFLNIVAAAALAASGARRSEIAAALVEQSAHVLLEAAGRHDPRATRRFFRSFGSCSFREPADELARINGI